MKTPDTITERLHNKADKKLKDEIEAIISAVHCAITYGEHSLYSYQLRELDSDALVNGFGMLDRMKAMAFEGMKDRRRNEAVSEFMARVETLSVEIEELKNSIPQ